MQVVVSANMFRYYICVFIITSCLWVIAISQRMLGPANLIYTAIEKCDDSEDVIKFTVKQKKYNRTTYVMDIFIEVPFSVDDSVVLEMKGSIKKEGGYKEGSFYLKDAACRALSTMMGDMFTDLLKAAGTDDCPLPAGKHEIIDFYFDNEKFTVPQLYGDYKMEVQIYKDEEVICCYYLYYQLVPKDM